MTEGTTRKLNRNLMCAVALALPAAAMAQDYTYVEGGYVSRDGDLVDDNGIRIAGSGAVAPQFALIGEYQDTGNFEQLSAGGLVHGPVDRNIDWTAGATLEFADARHDDDTGFGLRGGLRLQFAKYFELAPEVRYVNLFDHDMTSIRVAGLVGFTPNLQFQAALQGGDDDSFELGLRYQFTPTRRYHSL